MKQKLADWASIAEITGAAAIVVSLVFVGFQIRENTIATQSATFQEHLGFEISVLNTVASDPTLSRLYLQTAEGLPLTELDGDEEAQATWIWTATYRLWEGYFLQYRQGMMSEDGWAAREPTIRLLSELPIACTFTRDSTLSGEYQQYILDINPAC